MLINYKNKINKLVKLVNLYEAYSRLTFMFIFFRKGFENYGDRNPL